MALISSSNKDPSAGATYRTASCGWVGLHAREISTGGEELDTAFPPGAT